MHILSVQHVKAWIFLKIKTHKIINITQLLKILESFRTTYSFFRYFHIKYVASANIRCTRSIGHIFDTTHVKVEMGPSILYL